MQPRPLQSPHVVFAPNSSTNRHEIAVLVFVIAIVALIIAGGAAIYCIAMHGSLEWTQYFVTFVKVACKFK